MIKMAGIRYARKREKKDTLGEFGTLCVFVLVFDTPPDVAFGSAGTLESVGELLGM
jgi:hypothetical protein